MLELIGILVAIVIVYAAYIVYDYKKNEMLLNKPLGKVEEPVQVNPDGIDMSKLRSISMEELHKNNGVNTKNVWLAIKELVFDVSTSEAYAPDGSYGVFAGQECSVAFAKMDMSGQHLNEYGSVVLRTNEIETMNQWTDFFIKKYQIIGKLSNKKD